MVKLHLGCGVKKIPGYINIDKREEVNPDVSLDISNIYPLYENVEVIYACHVLEHFSRIRKPTYTEVLKNWYKALKPQGILRLSVPDFKNVCKMYMEGVPLGSLQGFLNGGQKNILDTHFVNFDFQFLKEELLAVGFKNINEYNWRLTEHSQMDDYSQAYIPHMDKEKGILMSLNIECVK